MAGPITYSETVLSDFGAQLIARLINGAAIANPLYEVIDGSNNILWSVALHATTPLVYSTGGILTYKRPGTDVFLGYAPVGIATGDIASFRVRGLDDAIHISGLAGLTGSGNPLELASLAVVNGVAGLPFSGEPTHRVR